MTTVHEIGNKQHLADLIVLAHMMHKENAPFLTFDPKCIEEYYEAIANDMDRENYTAFVAYKGLDPVGFCLCVAGPYFFSRQIIARQELWFVHPHHRNGRVAFKLMQAFEEWARLRGAVQLYTGVMTQDQPEAVERVSNLLTHMSYPLTGHYHSRVLIKKEQANDSQ